MREWSYTSTLPCAFMVRYRESFIFYLEEKVLTFSLLLTRYLGESRDPSGLWCFISDRNGPTIYQTSRWLVAFHNIYYTVDEERDILTDFL
jgi:hypothetical protein